MSAVAATGIAASLPCAGVVTQTADCKAATTDTGMSTVFEKFVQEEVEYFIDVDESLQGNLSEQAREIFEIIKETLFRPE